MLTPEARKPLCIPCLLHSPILTLRSYLRARLTLLPSVWGAGRGTGLSMYLSPQLDWEPCKGRAQRFFMFVFAQMSITLTGTW